MKWLREARTVAPVLTTRNVEVGDWQETPRWHWRRLFGWRMRRLQLEGDFAPSEVWEYYTPRQAARIILAEKYAPREHPLFAWDVDDVGGGP